MRSFMQMQEGNHLLIIDSLNLAFRYKGKPNFVGKYIGNIRSLGSFFNCKHIILVADWGSNWRKEIYPDYKANRVEKRAAQTEEEAEEFKQFMDEYHKALRLLEREFNVFRFKGVEGDDIAAYIVTRYEYYYDKVYLVSTDNDWTMLISDKTSIFNTRKNKEIDKATFIRDYGFSPALVAGKKAIQGDEGDNIHGVPGIGDKRSLAIMQQYPDIHDLINNIPVENKKKVGYINALNENKELVEQNLMLVDLPTYCAEALGASNGSIIDEKLNDLLEELDD